MKRHSPAKAVIDIFSASGTRGLAGHLQTHPFIVAKTAMRELTAVNCWIEYDPKLHKFTCLFFGLNVGAAAGTVYR